jgi:hypothetical protein
MSVTDSEKFRLLILQIRYLKAQLLVDEKVLQEAQTKFAKAYQEVCKTVPEHERKILEGALNEESKENAKEKEKKQSQPDTKGPPESEEGLQDEPRPMKQQKPEDPSVKKIYRAIATKSHPDKLTGAPEEEVREKEKLFKEAKNAIKEKDFLTLYDIAKRLDIDLPPPEKGQINLLTKNVKRFKKDLKLIKETTAWQWHHEEEEQRKEALLIRYMQYIYTRFK